MNIERIDGAWVAEGKKQYSFHIERTKAPKCERGIKGGRIKKLYLYENNKLEASYNQRWNKQPTKLNIIKIVEGLIKKYNK